MEGSRKGFAIYHDADDPVSIAIHVYAENRTIKRDIDVSREGYQFTRYLGAVK